MSKELRKPYPVYKGLQKPLVFKGIKGKFIYWSAGGILTCFFLSFGLNYLLGAFPSILIAGVLIYGLIYYINYKQKTEGIYKKDKSFGIIRINPSYKIMKNEEK
ncbi:DUF4133 domain-containing protein [Tenacibaculum finnmarkense]|uniref:DUF4133 domain-containing protein n=1 Tax=Tenacibaculum finnmarkense TaxID=2781243 RepID=UPI001EFA6DF0|nr:DUF4133 domain-containing protein [Tenacibaculum finnmarkense]MCG8226385.1 DUF4133 domain-containing protein [Tenacibaculum finnmarkense genomovar finnmarkense]